MRRFTIILALAIGIGCGKTERPVGPDVPSKTEGASFDSESAERTADWAMGLTLSIKTPAGNEAAYREAVQSYEAQVVAGAKGKKINWRMPVCKVSPNWDINIGNVSRLMREPPKGSKAEPDYFLLGTVPPNYFNGVTSKEAIYACPPTGFVPADTSAAWLRSLKEGDKVSLSGSIGRITVQRGFVLFEIVGASVAP